eukprot:1576757-Amphidinium_carterae.1
MVRRLPPFLLAPKDHARHPASNEPIIQLTSSDDLGPVQTNKLLRGARSLIRSACTPTCQDLEDPWKS